MDRARWIGAVAALLAAMGAGLWFGGSASGPPPVLAVATGTSSAVAEAVAVTVHVSGAVRAPGLVRVEPGARVADVVAAAGGLTPDAEPAALNLAAVVSDGMQVVVPRTGAGAVAGPAPDGRVRVNHATVAELEALPGVGPVLASRIAAYRDQHGPFRTAEDLLDVPGIGEAKLEGLRDALDLS